MFTSYYAKHGTNRNAVAISAKPPEWYVGVTYPLLAPSWDLIRAIKAKTITEEEYTINYLKLIKSRGASPHRMISDLGEDAILLCYETPNDFCHRHIVAWWAEHTLGIVIPEISLIKQQTIVDDLFTF